MHNHAIKLPLFFADFNLVVEELHINEQVKFQVDSDAWNAECVLRGRLCCLCYVNKIKCALNLSL